MNTTDFDIDELYNITKLSKRSDNLSFSVVFIADASNKITPHALYRGKENKLGSGGFGDVKLCQNLETGDWLAIKTQQAMMREPSQSENAVLSVFDRFKGQMSRDRKYYSVQTLLHGVNLKEHLDSAAGEDLATRLLIAEQAITLVSNFHETYLHRDIKPENFMWDSAEQKLHLCDFGFSCKIDEDGAFNDISGTGTFLAPEIDGGGRVDYTKKSDIYALGKTLEEVFQGVDVPDQISNMIKSMSADDANEREANMGVLLDTVKTERAQLEQPSFQI